MSKNKFSNIVFNKNGKFGSPDFYLCVSCGIKLTESNTYKNAFCHKQYICKECSKMRSRDYHRHFKISQRDGCIIVKDKIPKHPKNNNCMLCGKPPTRRTGLSFHHWEIINGIAFGLWLCNICHMFAERVDNGFVKNYLKLKKLICRKR